MLLGDWLAIKLEKIGAPACLKCKQRQEKLNQMHTKIKSYVEQSGRGGSSSSSSTEDA